MPKIPSKDANSLASLLKNLNKKSCYTDSVSSSKSSKVANATQCPQEVVENDKHLLIIKEGTMIKEISAVPK